MKPKIAIGERVRLSKVGRTQVELRPLARKRGMVVDYGPIRCVLVVEWGRSLERWHNHEDNLDVVPWNG